MVDAVVEVLSWICLGLGSFFAVVGGIGLLRLPDFFCRIHGGGITDTMGAGMVLLGLMLHAGGGLETVKLVTILFFLLVSSPTSAHALARAAVAHGIDPACGEDGPSRP